MAAGDRFTASERGRARRDDPQGRAALPGRVLGLRRARRGRPPRVRAEPARRPGRTGAQHPGHGRPRCAGARGGHRRRGPPYPARPAGRAGRRRRCSRCSPRATSSAGCAAASRCSPSTPGRPQTLHAERRCEFRARRRSRLARRHRRLPGAVLPLARRGAGARRRGRGTPARALLDDVKEVAWTNRDIAPELATIIIDTIRTRARPPARAAATSLIGARCRRTAEDSPPWPTTSSRRSARGSSCPLALVLVVGLFCLLFVRPSTASTGPDQVSLHYKGGAFTSKRFSDCIAPSTRVFDGPGDGHFAYPRRRATSSSTTTSRVTAARSRSSPRTASR